VTLNLSTVEKYILDSLTHQGLTKKHWHAEALDYLRLSNAIPTITKREMVALACDFSKVMEYDPLLSKTSMEKIRYTVSMWLELCVLQDKCTFLLSISHEPSRNKDFSRELTSQRSWDTESSSLLACLRS
jgi:hypothetical protein